MNWYHFKFDVSKNHFTKLPNIQTENKLISRNKRVYFTCSLQSENIGDFKEVDLIKQPRIKFSQERYKYGLSLSKDKKWFLNTIFFRSI